MEVVGMRDGGMSPGIGVLAIGMTIAGEIDVEAMFPGSKKPPWCVMANGRVCKGIAARALAALGAKKELMKTLGALENTGPTRSWWCPSSRGKAVSPN
jgi:hypothetical protein